MTERKRLLGFQKPRHSEKIREVGFAMVSYEGNAAQCNCGAVVVHRREKVREDWVDKHLAEKHGGRGLRL